MSLHTDLPIGQHDQEIHKNRASWQEKPELREVYGVFYRRIRSELDFTIAGSVVELGSGIGAIKSFIPQCITTDIFPNPWLDRVENAYQLGFPNCAISNLILFDVWHHLRYPGTALREFHRVLAPGGRVVLFEPAISWLGRVVYGLFHHEPIGMRRAICWDAPTGFRPENADYFACQGSATRFFWHRSLRCDLSGWDLLCVDPLVTLSYFATGGFSGPRPNRWVMAVARSLDRILQPCPRLFAGRLLIVLKKCPCS